MYMSLKKPRDTRVRRMSKSVVGEHMIAVTDLGCMTWSLT